eukprot:COSAG06_NODE_6128_length_3095_cov_53.870069_3_plen_50_part_00
MPECSAMPGHHALSLSDLMRIYSNKIQKKALLPPPVYWTKLKTALCDAL